MNFVSEERANASLKRLTEKRRKRLEKDFEEYVKELTKSK